MKERHVDIIPIPQAPVQYLIWHEDNQKPVGYCLITAHIRKGENNSGLIGLGGKELKTSSDTKEAVIWHIYVDKEYRRQGYARTLIEALKVHHDSIVSQGITSDGKKLLMSTGFVVDDDMKKNVVKVFRWTKKL